MKNIIFYLLAIIGIGVLSSCEKVNENPILDLGNIVPPSLTEPADGADIVLTEENQDDTITFAWTATQYNVETLPATSYLLQADTVGSNFSNAKNLVSTLDTKFNVSQGKLNEFLLGLGLTAGKKYSIEFRVLSFLVQENEDTWSNSTVINTSVTTYEGAVPAPDLLWVPGDYQGWNPAEAPNVFSPDHNGQYGGFIYFPPGGTFEFKFTSAPDWNHINYGDGGDGILNTDPGAGNLKVPGEGNYYLQANTEDLTWDYALRNYALIGSFNNWSADEPLTWDSNNWRWEVTLDLEAGAEFKWRANGDWTYNLGDNEGDGILEQDGANIKVEEAANYTIYLYLYEPQPRYEIIKN
jgi:hypothetical protein